MGDTLPLRIKRPLRAVPEHEWTWGNEAAAICSTIGKSGLQEKSIAIEIGLDPSTLAKVKQGTARMPEECLSRLMDATGDETWLFYWLLHRGYDPRSLRRFENDVERENRELKEQMAQLEKERDMERRIFAQLMGKAA